MKRTAKIIILYLFTFGLSSLSLASDEGGMFSHRLTLGERIKVMVVGHPDISGEHLLNADGLITIPFAGQILAAGKTINEMEEIIKSKLNKEYIVDPQVHIEIISYPPFFILGQVRIPGSYDYHIGLNVRKAVALAGGFTARARESTVTLLRYDGKEEIEIQAELDTPVFPGDTIDVQKRLF